MTVNIINFDIKNIFPGCGKNKQDNITFELIKNKAIKYTHLLPDFEKDFLYLKILTCGKIIACEGKYAKFLGLKRKKVLKKNIKDLEICQEFFDEYIIPIFEDCIKHKEPYQFTFISYKKKKKKEHRTCSFYPCYIPINDNDELSSIDLVIRKAKHNIEKENISKYII